MKINLVGILGGAELTDGNPIYKEVFNVSKMLAENGRTILNGEGPGLMRASTDGAHAGGGKVIGITFFPKYFHPNFEGKDPENKADEEIITADYFERTRKLLEMSQCHIIFDGGTGTISEFGMSWAQSRIHEGHNIPIILYGEFWNKVIEAFEKYMYLREGEKKLYHIAKTPEEVLEIINGFEK